MASGIVEIYRKHGIVNRTTVRTHDASFKVFRPSVQTTTHTTAWHIHKLQVRNMHSLNTHGHDIGCRTLE